MRPDEIVTLLRRAIRERVLVPGQSLNQDDLAKRFGVQAAHDLVPPHPTLGDVDSPQALRDYQAAKRAHKAEWSKLKAR